MNIIYIYIHVTTNFDKYIQETVKKNEFCTLVLYFPLVLVLIKS